VSDTISHISLYQKRFWLEWKLDLKSTKYNTPLIYKIIGNLNIDALSKALSDYVNHFHCSSRHYFFEQGSKIEQRKLRDIQVDIDFETISVTNENLDSVVDAYVHKVCSHIFNLAHPPLFKCGLLKINDDIYILVLNYHHIISDAYTGGFLVEMVGKLYNHYSWGLPLPIITGPTFEDYLVNERTHYSLLQEKEDLNYWKAKLINRPLSIDFNFKKQNLLEHRKSGDSVYFSLDQEMTSRLQHLTKNLGTTVFIVLSGLYALLLRRYTGQKTIVMSYPVNTRPIGFHNTPGCFVNNVPMVVDFNKDFTFVELIQYCTAERKEAKKHQFCSLTDIVQHLKKEQKLMNNNYFNVSIMETFLNPKPLNLKDINVSCIKYTPDTTFNDLSLSYQLINHQSNYQLEFRLDYRQDVFELSIINQLIKHLIFIVKCCIQDSNKKINSFSLLQEDELQLIEQWNDTDRAFPEEKTIDQLFEEQAAKTPNAIAVTYEGKSLTYRELNVESDNLAQLLQEFVEKSLKKSRVIGLCMNKDLDLVISILGILKAGFAYLPLDPNDAEDRTNSILKDAEVDIILTDKKEISTSYSSRTSSQQNTCSEQSHSSRDLAYVIYTSGSTGKPKGVMIEHRSVTNLILDIKEKLNITEKDRILSVAAVTFDIYALELFLALFSGANHIICPKNIIPDPIKLANFTRKNKPTLIQATPSLLSMLISYLKKEESQFVILCGGEILSEHLAKNLTKLSDTVWNVYGPTETTIWSSFFRLNNELNNKISNEYSTYIGRAFANTKLHVLDEELNSVPIGVIGELYISGIGLARGYLNDYELTKTKFIINNKNNRSGILMYRTYDLVRWTDSGYLEYIGRSDLQVKIRGHRIELGEIEAACLKHPAIISCVVDLHKYSAPEMGAPQIQEKIVLYYTLKKLTFLEKMLKGTVELSIEDLYNHLKRYLPLMMMPSAFIELETLPLTINGKVDRQRLPPPKLENYLINVEKSQPFDSVELRLKEIWCNLLSISDIGLRNNFFMIGGNSLLAIHLVSEINEQFKVQMSVSWVLENNTIESQGLDIRNNQDAVCLYRPVIHFNAKGKKRSLFLIHPGFAGAEVYSEFARHLDKNISFYAIDSYNLNSGQPFIKTIEELANYYIMQIQKLQPVGPYFLGGWSLGGFIAYEMAQQLIRLGEAVEVLYLLDTHIYSSEYLKYIHENSSVEVVIEQLPEERGKHLAALPERYLDQVISSFRNDLKLLMSYTIKPYSGKILLTKTTKATSLNAGLIENRYNGWKKYAKTINQILIDATHFGLMEGESAKQVALAIEEDIDRVEGSYLNNPESRFDPSTLTN